MLYKIYYSRRKEFGMTKNIKLIIGSTRQNRVGSAIAPWIVEKASTLVIAVEVIDLKELDLPPFDAPVPPAYQQTTTKAGLAWAKTVEEIDGFIFLTPEYNRSIPSSLKNAIDYLSPEWKDKQAAIVSYGYVDGGQSAVAHLKDIFAWLKMDIIDPTVSLQIAQDHFDNGYFKDIDAAFLSYDAQITQMLKRLS